MQSSPLMDAALSAHFHIASTMPNSQKLLLINQIINGYNNVETTPNKSQDIFRYRTNTEGCGDFRRSPTDATPIDAAYTFFNATINFTRDFVSRGPMARAASVIHESVHFFDSAGGRPNDISEWYVTDAEALTLGLHTEPDRPVTEFATRYDLMNTSLSLHNPSSFAAFAQYIFFGRDTRFGAGHPD